MPFFLAIGNHETIRPKTARRNSRSTFADWLDAPAIREQRLKDDPHDHALRPYYHWIRDGIDFITLDNATTDQFDATQLAWLKRVLRTTGRNTAYGGGGRECTKRCRKESRARHSMSDAPAAETTGVIAYEALLDLRKAKPVYVLASHSHFVMENVYNTPYWQEHVRRPAGLIVGTAGAVRYPLPPDAWRAGLARTMCMGICWRR